MCVHHRFGLAGAFVLAVVLPASVARADAAGDAVLASMDGALAKATTMTVDWVVSTQPASGAAKTMALEVRRKLDRSYGAFAAPADMSGTKTLFVGPTEQYLYQPSVAKIARVLGVPAAGDAFLGLAYSYADLFRNRFGDQYGATISAQTATEYKLTLTAKSGVTTPYAKVVVVVAKDHMVPTQLQYFDPAGTIVKTETRTSYTCQAEVCMPSERKMVNGSKSLVTTLTRKGWTVNPELSDKLFATTTFAP